MFLAVLQLTIVLHVRNTVVDCAAEGARYGGLADRSAADGAQRTRDLITASLGTGYASDVRAGQAVVNGVPVIEVRVSAPLPALGLISAGHTLDVTGHGLVEGEA